MNTREFLPLVDKKKKPLCASLILLLITVLAGAATVEAPTVQAQDTQIEYVVATSTATATPTQTTFPTETPTPTSTLTPTAIETPTKTPVPAKTRTPVRIMTATATIDAKECQEKVSPNQVCDINIPPNGRVSKLLDSEGYLVVMHSYDPKITTVLYSKEQFGQLNAGEKIPVKGALTKDKYTDYSLWTGGNNNNKGEDGWMAVFKNLSSSWLRIKDFSYKTGPKSCGLNEWVHERLPNMQPSDKAIDWYRCN